MNNKPRRYTILFVTVNPHFEQDFTSGEEDVLVSAIDSLEATGNAIEALGTAFDGTVRQSRITRRGLEVGHKKGQLHAHFIWSIEHHGRVHLRLLNRNLQPYFDVHVKLRTYVRASLMDAKRLNYTAKKDSNVRATALGSRTILYNGR